MNEPLLSPRQLALLRHYQDLAQFECTGDQNVFWILDLDDPRAVLLAEVVHGKAAIEAERQSGPEIPSLSFPSTTLELNAYAIDLGTQEFFQTPDPHTYLYMVLCSEGAFLVTRLPALHAHDTPPNPPS